MGFGNYLVHMFTIIQRCVARKTGSRSHIEVKGQTKVKHWDEMLRPDHNLTMHKGIQKSPGTNVYHHQTVCCIQSPLVQRQGHT